jgi:S-adenosylmethionine:tRNA ribosyltransferase-isomerase
LGFRKKERFSLYRLEDYDYVLPEELIAQQPLERRDQSRLLHLQRSDGHRSHLYFNRLVDLLHPGDVLVLNDTQVIPGRLLGRKQTGGKVEALILNYAQGVGCGVFQCLLKASKRPKPGDRLAFDHGLEGQVQSIDENVAELAFSGPVDLERMVERVGHTPLPPYIRRADTRRDRQTYQTVYAAHKGAIAAPTAGLHFTRTLLNTIEKKGIRLAYLTLHVGYGTFLPVRVSDIRRHRMHAEGFTLSSAAAHCINEAKTRKRRVIAVGTTCVRTLEYCTDDRGRVVDQSGSCDLFIYPGYRFRAVDGMITNFHLPKSTLLMLVSAFAGRETILETYAEAVRYGYRFYSYGDAMFIS